MKKAAASPKLHDGFWRHVTETPEAPALNFAEKTYSYGMLGGYVAALQAAITDYHLLDKQHVIGVYAEKDITAYSGVLGILSSGNIYAPLGVKLPVARLRNIIDQAEIETLILSPEMFEMLPELLHALTPKHIIAFESIDDEITTRCSDHEFTIVNPAHLGSRLDSDSITPPKANSTAELAYLLFTSGSTGTPKGVPISHANACAYLENICGLLDFNSQDRFSQTFPLTFDLSVHDMFVCWSVGGCLCPIPDKKMMAPTQILRDLSISIWFSVPSQAALMQQFRQLSPNSLPSLRMSLFCGEALPEDIVTHWHKAAPESRIYNIYGPTEATIAITFYDATPTGKKRLKQRNGVTSVGQLFPSQKYKLDSPNEYGEGELLLSGTQVTSGYWKNQQATEKAFTQDDEGQKWYKTGDLFAQDKEGDLYFLTRLDHQVKLHGHRIELEEISSAVRAITKHIHVCTIVAGEKASAYLAVFIAANAKIEEELLINELKAMLPLYMIPKKIRFIEQMPTNASGKIDRMALKKML